MLAASSLCHVPGGCMIGNERFEAAVNNNPGLAIKEQKLLARGVTYYQHTFAHDKRGLNYLKNEFGITDSKSLTDFGAGFVNGTLLDILPQDDEIMKTLQRIGVLNKKGAETFLNCIVIPLYDQSGGVVNLYGRSI